jgi:hypothetical protein
MFTASTIVPSYNEKISESLVKSNIGTKILSVMGLCRSFWTYLMSYCSKFLDLINKFAVNYVWFYSKQVVKKFWDINLELSNNRQSQIVYAKFNENYKKSSSFIAKKTLEKYIGGFRAPPMAFMPNIAKPIKDTITPYKQIPAINIKMQKEELDDLDEELDIATPIENEITPIENEPEPVDKKALLRKKIADKKAQRTGMAPRHSPLMDSKSAEEMIETMMRDNNFDNIMKQMSNMDPVQMKKIMQNMR